MDGKIIAIYILVGIVIVEGIRLYHLRKALRGKKLEVELLEGVIESKTFIEHQKNGLDGFDAFVLNEDRKPSNDFDENGYRRYGVVILKTDIDQAKLFIDGTEVSPFQPIELYYGRHDLKVVIEETDESSDSYIWVHSPELIVRIHNNSIEYDDKEEIG